MTRSPGWSAPAGRPHLEHLGHRHQPPDQPQHRGVGLGRAGPARARRVDADHAALPRRLGQEGLPGPAALERGQRGEVHAAPVFPAEQVCDHRPMGTPYDRPVRVERRAVDERSRGAANGPDWDRYADEYQATHGSFLGDAGFLWGPEGLTEDEAGMLGEVSGKDVLEVGSGAGQCSRWVRTHGGRGVGVDLSFRQLQHSRRIDDETGIAVPAVLGTATALPFADDSFDVVFCSFGALQFVADIDDAVAETARVLRPGGRYAFSITHPTRWMFPDDPGPDGLTASQSYWDRTPYVEVEDAHRHGGLRRAPPHPRRLGGPAGRARLPDHRPPRARVARGPRPGLGRLVGSPRPAHSRHRDLRCGLGAALGEGRQAPAPTFSFSATRWPPPPLVALAHDEHEPAEQAQDAAAEADDREHGEQDGQLLAGGLGLVDGLLDRGVGLGQRDVGRRRAVIEVLQLVLAALDDRAGLGVDVDGHGVLVGAR